MSTYQEFLEGKISLAPKTGFSLDPALIHPLLKPHQRDVVIWNCAGGCRADFLSFGLGKTIIQIETLRHISQHNIRGRVLIVCPLGVKHEFQRDGKKLGIDRIKYITSTSELEDGQLFYITNYERIRRGTIDASMFSAVSFDEASILRSLDTDTTQTILETFQTVPFRFVCTATPSPNRYLELINYAEYLGIMDRGQALTRFFKRDSTTAGNLTLFDRRANEFWHWMSSWACFITKPSDLGYDDTGYDLPKLEVIPHRVSFERPVKVDKKTGQSSLVADSSKSLTDAAKEKRDSMEVRVNEVCSILHADQFNKWLIWHHLEAERHAIQKALGDNCKSVWGSQNMDQREEFLTGFAEGKYEYLSTKPEIAGSGVNLQYFCHKAVFVGIDYKFNDFIQACHRIYRFGQTEKVEVHIIYTDGEDEIYKTLMQKWENHRTLQSEMTSIIQQFGLNADLSTELSREMFTGRQVEHGAAWTFVNNDCVAEWQGMESDSLDLIVTSIPFGNHYEYSENYNCFGHNPSNEAFFEQMDYLVPDLYRTLKPGRIACIHVKDRIRYSYMNGTGFSSIDPFSDDTTRAFRKHGFHLLTRITVDTDVVRENASTYRLGWTEACKDMTKMGAGLPEYVLVFRKAPSSSDNAYADTPVMHDKEQYSRGRWQLDAHAHWKSSGERLIDIDQLRRLNHKDILKLWKELEATERYDFHRHARIHELLDELHKLPSGFMTLPPQSNHSDIWDDVSRMKTLNAEQVKKGWEMHICLAEGTLILTQKGYIPIQDVEIGDVTLTHTGQWKPIIAKQLTGENKPVIKTHAQGVPNLITTPTHKLWTRTGDKHHPRTTMQRAEPQWKEAKDTLANYLNLKLPPVIESDLSETDWWLIGRWLADGHIDHKGHQFIVSIGTGKMDEFTQKAGPYFGAVHELSATQVCLKNLPKGLREILFKCGKGAKNKRLPIEAISLNQSLSEALLSGYLSGDGHKDSLGRYSATSVSRSLLLSMAIVAQRARGIVASVYAGKKAGTTVIEGRSVNTCQEWIMLLSPRNGSGIILDDGAWKKVRKIESAGTSDVWNIRVADDESYTAEGCVVKNCPLQLDIIERLIERYSNPGELVADPFGGIASTLYMAVKMKRQAFGTELATDYWRDGLKHLRSAELSQNALTLFADAFA